MSRKPDYRLKVLNKDTDDKGDIGCGWRNEDGSIRIVLNHFVTLAYDPKLVIHLFPTQENQHAQTHDGH